VFLIFVYSQTPLNGRSIKINTRKGVSYPAFKVYHILLFYDLNSKPIIF